MLGIESEPRLVEFDAQRRLAGAHQTFGHLDQVAERHVLVAGALEQGRDKGVAVDQAGGVKRHFFVQAEGGARERP